MVALHHLAHEGVREAIVKRMYRTRDPEHPAPIALANAG